MAARLDLEARLKALRAPKSPVAAGPAALSVSAIDYGEHAPPVDALAPPVDALAWPAVPVVRVSRRSSSVATDEHGWPAAPNMTTRVGPDGWPQVPEGRTQRRVSARAGGPAAAGDGGEAAGPSWLPVRLQVRPLNEPPQPKYEPPQPKYEPPQPKYEPSQPKYEPPQPRQEAPQPQYEPPQPQYELPRPPQLAPSPARQLPAQRLSMRTPTDRQETPLLPSAREQEQLTSTPERAEPSPSAAELLGPDYTEAVRVAQRAIMNERMRHVRTAIDDYILAGQLLIGIGRRQQHSPDLQDVVKKKALALLHRAEGLSEWMQQVQSLDASQEAIDAAFQASQANQDRAMYEQEELVSKMQSDNNHMKQRLNQLVVLTKMRARLRRIVRERRARKKAEAEAQGGDDEVLSQSSWDGPDTNDVEGLDEDEDVMISDEHWNTATSSSFEDGDDDLSHVPLPSRVSSFRHSEHSSGTVPETQEEKKVHLVNELHAVIGLPEIDHLRKFEPLRADANEDAKQAKLQSELEKARKEAEELRAAVQGMERTLRLAAEHSKQRSIKIEQEKQEDIARVRRELDHVREQLEHERRMSNASSMGSRRSSIMSDVDLAREREDFESSNAMRSLRSSLFKVFSHKKSRDSLSGANDDPASTSYQEQRSVVQRTSEAHNSPRHRSMSSTAKIQRQTQHPFDTEEDEEDGGVWL